MNSRMMIVCAGVAMAISGAAQAQNLYGVMFRTGGQTSGLQPKLYDINPATGAATNPRNVNVNSLVGVAVSPAGTMYGLTDQFGRINNISGVTGKNLLVTIDAATGAAVRVGQLDAVNTSNDAALAVYEGDIAFQPGTGVLYGISTRVTYGTLFTIDTTTGAGTIVAQVQPPVDVPINPNTNQREVDMSALAFRADGALFVLDTTYPVPSSQARLYRVDPSSGAVLNFWQTSTVLGACAGMAFVADGSLLIADGDTGGTANVYRFNFGTSQLELVGATGAAGGIYAGLSGLAYVPPQGPTCGVADFNGDGDTGTDADIEAFFACLAGACCPTCGVADFNGDGDTGTDADIEAFFRVLAGGAC